MFTGFVLLGVLWAGIVLGLLTNVPYVEHVFFVLMTVAGAYESLQDRATLPAILMKAGCVIFFAAAACLYYRESRPMFAVEFAALAGVWFAISVQSIAQRHKMRSERLRRLDAVVSSVRRAKVHFDQELRDD